MSLVIVVLGYNKDITQCVDVAVYVAVGWIYDTLTVNGETIGVQFGREWSRCHSPYAIFLFRHVESLAGEFIEITGDADLCGCGIKEIECHGAVLMNDGRFHVWPTAQLLLCHAAHYHETADD